MHNAHRHAVLVVDDYDDLREGLTTMLSLYGFEARGASSGSTALGVLAEGYHPCLILLDLWMPDMNGWDVWATLRAHPETADIPVLLLSGDSSVVLDQGEGIAGLLPKPCEAKALVAAVHEHAHCTR